MESERNPTPPRAGEPIRALPGRVRPGGIARGPVVVAIALIGLAIALPILPGDRSRIRTGPDALLEVDAGSESGYGRARSLRTRDMSVAPATLEALWAAFSEHVDPSRATLADFERWFTHGDGAQIAIDLLPDADWSVAPRGADVTVSLRNAERSGDTWLLEVQQAPWIGKDYTLACHDLRCVVCHLRAERDMRRGRAAGPVRVASFVDFAEPVGSTTAIEGEVERLEGEAERLRPDFEAWVRATEGARGTLEFAHGCSVPIGSQVAAEGLELSALGPGRIGGRASGHAVAVGSPSHPVLLDGDVVIEGDLVLSGTVRGDGQIVALGNVFLVGDLLHEGSGTLRVAAAGSILAGDVTRPRQGESEPVTGGPDGSFSFLMEALARFNGAAGAPLGAVQRAPYALHLASVAPSLFGERASGEWSDPALHLIEPHERAETSVVGPAGTPPWIDLADLDAVDLGWTGTGSGGAAAGRNERSTGTTLEAAIVAGGAFVAIAANSRPESPSTPSGTPAGGLRIRGALVARHAAIHAPVGVWIQDDAHARAAQSFPARRGIVRRMRLGRDSNDRGADADRLPPAVGAPHVSIR